MQVLLVSPYHGGSHRSWAEGLRRFSELEIGLLTLPARFWKWRMHGGAVTLARRFVEQGLSPQVLLATDMLDVTTFLALTRPFTTRAPLALYMHENQLTYPLPGDGRSGPMRRQKGERDLHYAFINFTSMLAADRVLFNSRFHLESMFAELPKFLRHYPEYNELNAVVKLRRKSEVLPVGIDLQRLAYQVEPVDDAALPLIVWNQRWEYDKNPKGFFRALFTLADEGVGFRLALCGEQFGKRPSIFNEAIARLGERVVHVGYAEPDHYRQLLWEADVTVSTAHHEFFGISVLEAIYCHTFPVLPHRLSYPELIPEPYHLRCLYQNRGGLLERLRWALTHRDEAQKIARELATAVAIYDWPHIAPRYDNLLTSLAAQ
ncbi:MAG: DUF3524 domain-containing protein [Ardenticatenaceae bacterium]|nr:DUF3524 domain-containing protein [Ardenticatenaceae bacterium]MCB9003782.1 DUF3524 domain-containing protein [Ardenticatenaceae bacterium]